MTPIPVRYVPHRLVTIGVEWNFRNGQWSRYLLRKVPGTQFAMRQPLHRVLVDAPYCPCCLVPALEVDEGTLCPLCASLDRGHEGSATG